MKNSHAIRLLQQLPVRPLLNDSAVFEDKYAVTVDYGAEPVGDAYCGPALTDLQ